MQSMDPWFVLEKLWIAYHRRSAHMHHQKNTTFEIVNAKHRDVRLEIDTYL